MNHNSNRKSKLKKLAGSVIFLGLAAAMLLSITYMLRPNEDGNYRSTFPGFYQEKDHTLDVISLGSSAIYRFYNPPYLWQRSGLTSYNLASGTMPLTTFRFVMEEVEKTQSPQLYIIGTRSLVVEPNERYEIYIHRVSDNMDFTFTRMKMINHCIDTLSDKINFIFDLILYHDNWEDLNTRRVKYWDNRVERNFKGWKNVMRAKEVNEFKTHENVEEVPLLEDAEEELYLFLEDCKAHNRNVLFVANPWGHSDKIAGRYKTLGRIVESYGYKFLNMNEHYDEFNFNYSNDFYNYKHTNVWGSRKVTAFLADYLEENYDLVKDHSPETIEAWNEAAKQSDADLRARVEKALKKAAEKKAAQAALLAEAQTASGEAAVQAPAGEAAVQAPAGEAAVQAPAGETAEQAPAGEDDELFGEAEAGALAEEFAEEETEEFE